MGRYLNELISAVQKEIDEQREQLEKLARRERSEGPEQRSRRQPQQSPPAPRSSRGSARARPTPSSAAQLPLASRSVPPLVSRWLMGELVVTFAGHRRHGAQARVVGHPNVTVPPAGPS
jgi:hypothetical protein